MKKSTTIFFLLILTTISGADQLNQDSLWSIWKNETVHDSTRLNALSSISYYTGKNLSIDSTLVVNQLYYDFSKEINENNHVLLALSSMVYSHKKSGFPKTVINLCIEAINLCRQMNDNYRLCSFLIHLSSAYNTIGHKQEAITGLSEALQLGEEMEDADLLARIYIELGYTAVETERAIDYYKQALKYSEISKDSIRIAKNLYNLGGRAQDLAEEADTLINLKSYAEAIKYYSKSLEISKKINYEDIEAYSLFAIANIHFLLDTNMNEVPQEYFECLEKVERLKNYVWICYLNSIIADIYIKKNDYNKAIFHAQKGYKISSQQGLSIERTINLKVLVNCYTVTKQFKKALEYQTTLHSIKDSLNDVSVDKALFENELNYEMEKKNEANANKMEKEKIKHQAELEKEANQRYMLYAGVLFLLSIGGIGYFGYLRKKKDHQIISKQKDAVEQQKEIIEKAHKELTNSIDYAKRIQSALLPPLSLIEEKFKDIFVLYKPKDVVAGDFYWMEPIDDGILFAAADCTGHGVPGAMVSVICNGSLNRSVREFGLLDPGNILDKTRELVIQEFEKSREDVKDGMDIALCKIEGCLLSYSGANNPLWIIRDEEVIEIKANKQPIGKYFKETPFTSHKIKLEKGDSIYLFSDGYIDQFGGKKEKKYMSSKFKKFLVSIQSKSMKEQYQLLDQEFLRWKGKNEQIDDVCVIGIKI